MEKGIALLGVDLKSAVAIIMLRNRLEIIPIHFGVRNPEIINLAEHLGLHYLYFVPFEAPKDPLVARALMVYLADKIAQKEYAKFIITGENVPSISSEALSTMQQLNYISKTTIIRPIFSLSEAEIKRISKENDLPLLNTDPSLDLVTTNVKNLREELSKYTRQADEWYQQAQLIEL